jgi:GGDEF domain-containing protein
MVLPGASVDDAEKVAKRLRQTVGESHANVGAQSIGVTVSTGYRSYNKQPMATVAHGKRGIYTDISVCGYLS